MPANFAYAAASYQLTPATGCFSCPFGKLPSSQVAGPERPVASRKRAMASVHGNVLPVRDEGLLPEVGLLVSAGVDELLVLLVGHLVLIDPVVVERHLGKMIEPGDREADLSARPRAPFQAERSPRDRAGM